MNTIDYSKKMKELLNEPSYKILHKDPTSKIERKTAILIRKSGIPDDIIKKIIPTSSVPPRLYGLPKIHKDNVPLRPIVNCIGSSTYLLAKHLAGLVGPLVGLTEHHIRNSASFIEKLQTICLQESDISVSFDVLSLFTRVPLNDTLQLLEQHFDNKMIYLFWQALRLIFSLKEDFTNRQMAWPWVHCLPQ
jgi:hypothetical protein